MPLRSSLRRLAIVVVPLACVEGVVYPLILHDSTISWLSYIAYLALAVILPGTLVAQAFVRWRADWLTWIGLGWAVGQVLEVVSIQLAKLAGMPRLFIIWILIAYLLAWRKQQWDGEVRPVTSPLRCASLLAVVLTFASTTFVALKRLELSPQPTYQSDVWFHVNEAHEFRDHLDTADPRIVGEPYAYHTLEYGPAAGANLAVEVPLANLITRYSGLSMVWLLVLLLFNAAREIRGPAAGFLAAALIVAPLDIFSLISSRLSFGSSIIYSGLDLSTSTLVGFWAMAALFLPVRWLFLGGRLRDLWVVTLLAYMGAGSKSVPGPLLLVAGGAVVAGTVLQRRKPALRSLLLLGTFLGVFAVTALPILARATVVDSATITFGSIARLNPYADQLTRIPMWLRLGFYPIGLAFMLWVGLAAGLWVLVKTGERELAWFLGGAILFGAAIVDFTSIPGHSELFFLYMAMVLVAPAAGMGLGHIGQVLWRGRTLATPAVAMVVALIAFGVHLKVGGTPSLPLYDGSRWTTGLTQRISAGVDAYRGPGPPSRPAFSWADGGKELRVTPGILAGLTWLRGVAHPSTAIATNVPGAALYAAYCECREYYQTEQYAAVYIQSQITGKPTTVFSTRARLLEAWMSAEPGSIEALRRAGVTCLVVDRVNGVRLPDAGMPHPAYSNADIAIYLL